MCLAIPVRIIKINKNIAEVNADGVIQTVDVRLVKHLRVGDYVLVHAGFVIEKLKPEDAKETLKLFEEME